MTLLFTGATSGFMVIWDRQFGFLKEIMVTPNSRISIVLGRIAGGATTAFVPSLLLIGISILLGFRLYLSVALLSLFVFITLVSMTFISVGLILASFIDDPQAFGVITNFVTFPLFFLSGAIFPLSGLPEAVQAVSYINPLTYGVDGIRFALVGTSSFSPIIDLIALLISTAIMLMLSTLAFQKAQVD